MVCDNKDTYSRHLHVDSTQAYIPFETLRARTLKPPMDWNVADHRGDVVLHGLLPTERTNNL